MTTENQPKKKKKITQFIAEIILIIVLFLGIRMYLQKDMVVGDAPHFTATTLQEEVLDISNLEIEKPMLIHFWASWCGICRTEHGGIEKLSKDYPVYTIAMLSGNKQEVSDFIEKNNWKTKTIVDEDKSLSNLYGVKAVPANFIIDKHGKIRFRSRGFTSEWVLGLQLWWINLTTQ